jgi:branched-chain amino acid transport system substrate-binding protein
MALTRRGLLPAFGFITASLVAGAVHAQDTVKVGIVAHFSGPFAVIGKQFREGIEAYQSVNGSKAGGRQVQIVYRDVGGANPAAAKQAVQELVVKDQVEVLGGFYLTPDAAASIPVLNETKVPGVIFNAAGRDLVAKSKYFVRIAGTIYQTSTPAAEWAYKSGKRKAYISVSDYAPGHDAVAAFKAKFTEMGGEIVGQDLMALNTVDYAPFIERIANSNADVAFNFVPNGVPLINFSKAFAARGLKDRGVTFLSLGLPDDIDLPKIGKDAIGFKNSLYWAQSLDTPENKAFIAAIRKQLGPDAMATNPQAQAWDGMQVIYQIIASAGGKKVDGDAAIEAIKGYSWVGPEGPMKIDPQTRNIIQNMYMREVREVNGQLVNVVVDTIKDVRDPGVPAN